MASFFDPNLLKNAKELLDQVFGLDILFSHGTYQIKTIDPVSKAEYWPFLQLDDRGNIKESFCNCDAEDTCIHIAVAYLILTKHDRPLHVLFEHSFFRKVMFDFFLLQKKEKEHFLGFKAEHFVYGNFFTLDALSSNVKQELLTLLTKEEETEETSLKFSNLTEKEMASYKRGIFPKKLKFELSVFSDLAKWLFTKYYLEETSVHIQYDTQDFPNKMRISFKDVEFNLQLHKLFLRRWLVYFKTIQCPLFVEDERKLIENVQFDPVSKTLEIQRRGKQAITKQQNAKEFYAFWYLPKQGFVLKQSAQERIDVMHLADYFDDHLDILKKHLPIFETEHPICYDVFFDKTHTLHINAYIQEKQDFLKPHSFVFGNWVYIEDVGFFKIGAFYFNQLVQTIEKKDLISFLTKHRLFFQDIPGFQVHLFQIDAHFSFYVDEEQTLHLSQSYSKTQDKGIDFGALVYLEDQGFFQKKTTPFQLKLQKSLVVKKKDLDRFIDQNTQELISIEGFFNESHPIEKMGLNLKLNQDLGIDIHVTKKLKEGIHESDLIFFKKYVYVKNQGFSSLNTQLLHFNNKTIPREKVYTFLTHEIYALLNFIEYLDPRLSKISHFSFMLDDIQFSQKWILDLSVLIGEKKIPFTTLLRALFEKEKLFFFDSGYLDLTEEKLEWIQNLAPHIIQQNHIELSTLEFFKLYSYAELNLASLLNQTHKKWIKDILDHKTQSKYDLTGFKSQLRSYQLEGVDWLWFLHEHGLSGLLCDEMGLGKTHQAMALIKALFNQKKTRFLIACPTSVLYHWEHQIATFLPELKVYVYHGQKRDIERFKKKYHVLLTSYGILRRKDPNLFSIDFDLAIFDEVQMAKNFQSQTFLALSKLHTKMRLGLTGTPIENKLRELKTLFDLILPGYLPSAEQFQKNFVVPIERYFDEKQTRLFQKLIHPFVLRRKKADVLKDLPPKVEQIRTCELINDQKTLYLEVTHSFKSKIEGQLKDKKAPFLTIFSLLTKLKMICDHPALFHRDYDNYTKYSSGKWDIFCELMHEALDSDQKLVIFTQYLGMIEIIKKYLNNLGLKYASIQGATIDRKKELKRFFEDRKCPVFIGSLRAVGLGVDLSVASCVIHYDRWWNPAWENQATDRVHRIGQVRGVQIYKLMTQHSIEESIDRMIQRKLKLFEILDQPRSTDVIKTFTQSDWLELLSSLPD
ncbi:MAG: RNA polymerase-associated protein RapA [Chlamydiae bacterium]|nr:RNA polymerase-associated protein RapA [Chlamydiota bacterium]